MKNLNICIDIDGTITDPYYWLDSANKYFNKNLKPEDVITYEINEIMGVTVEEYFEFYEIHGEEIHLNALAREDAAYIIRDLAKVHNIFYVTAREEKMSKATQKWFEEHKLPKAPIYFIGGHYKVDKAKELDCHIFIEDRYENAKELALAGIDVLLFDCYYNRLPLLPGITRINNWLDVKKEVKNYEATLSEETA
ncbi:hypothetical protein SAMN05660462_00364 [Proteiniborus ethanoligenes]|uniref:Nucleotidase n=1 Tax=Proteiniborus ethanoligenes TaxID=415015 RepID=A0A1H3KZ27_9FIRM|nr:hypothetical protein [Proteiniborus ethanoligenes]SDY56905.1 hypothetical protein SAMN05660462_00364 [Proteiniborus ethanoligenes]